MRGQKRGLLLLCAVMTALLAGGMVGAVPTAGATGGGGGGTSMRFNGNGTGDIDRVKIQVDDPTNTNPGPPADVGATDFTIEFWMKGGDDENTAPTQTCGSNINWIYGNILLDRDRYNQDRKFGLSIAGSKVVFGVSGDGTGDQTICGTSDVLTHSWHHVAVERRRSDGAIWLYVDGKIEAGADGPNGDVSYPDDGVPGPYCAGPCINSDPYLVIGAEKHDAGPAYPSFAGWFDELRISTELRYSGPTYTMPTEPFTTDANTAALYHFDEGAGNVIGDSSLAAGGPSNGERKYGGSPAGPDWSTYTPFWQSKCTSRPSSPKSKSYLAEGATKGGFETWILVANPSPTETAEACLTHLTSYGAKPGARLSIPPGARKSVKVNNYVTAYDVATIVEGVNNPVHAERAVYSKASGREGAHLGKELNTAETDWFLAEGATAPGFETWVLVANPEDLTATVQVTFLTPSGPVAGPGLVLYPGMRKSVRVNDWVPNGYDVSTKVHCASGKVVAERSTYVDKWPLKGATDSPGVPNSATSWTLAEGATAGSFDTWVLVANPGATPATVYVSFPGAGGTTPAPFALAAGARHSIHVDDYVPWKYDVPTVVTSTASVVAERAMYSGLGGSGATAASGEGPPSPGTDWLAVEGASAGGFETWVLIYNPGPGTATFEMDFLTPSGKVAGPSGLVLGPKSRKSVNVGSYISGYDVATRVQSNAPVIVERSVYTSSSFNGDATGGPAIKLA